MEIVPNSVSIVTPADSETFIIKNTSDVDVLLYKIRREDPKVVQFSPKAGMVEPGKEISVTIKFTEVEAARARVVVKSVTLLKANLKRDFEASWEVGARGSVQKTIVHVFNEVAIKAQEQMSDSEDSSSSSDSGKIDEMDMTGVEEDSSRMTTPAVTPNSARTAGTPTSASVLTDSHAPLALSEVGTATPPKGEQGLGLGLGLGLESLTCHTKSPTLHAPAPTVGTGSAAVSPLAMEHTSSSIDGDNTGNTFSQSGRDCVNNPEIVGAASQSQSQTHGHTTGKRTRDLPFPTSSGAAPVESDTRGRVGGGDSPARGYGDIHGRVATASELEAEAVAEANRDFSLSHVLTHGQSHRHGDDVVIAETDGDDASSQPSPEKEPSENTERGSSSSNGSVSGSSSVSGSGRGSGGGGWIRGGAGTVPTGPKMPGASESPQRSSRSTTSPRHAPIYNSLSRTGSPKHSSSNLADMAIHGDDTVVLNEVQHAKHVPTIHKSPSASSLAAAAAAGGASASPAGGASTAVGAGEKKSWLAAAKEATIATTRAMQTSSEGVHDRTIPSTSFTTTAMESSTSKKVSSSPPLFLVDIQGQTVSNDVAYDALRVRASEHIVCKERVSAIQIHRCPVDSLSLIFDGLFKLVPLDLLHIGDSQGLEPSDIAVVSELEALRGEVFDDRMRFVSVNHTKIERFDDSLNRFQRLTTLDLSHNHLTSISGNLALPHLQVLNVSQNFLKSLDCLQHLLSLRSLNASGNELASLHRSVHMLLPLARTLTRLDLSRNIVAAHPQYATTVVEVLKSLRFFDSRDLSKFSEKYTHNSGNPTFKLSSSSLQTKRDRDIVRRNFADISTRKGIRTGAPVLPADQFRALNSSFSNTSVSEMIDPNESFTKVIPITHPRLSMSMNGTIDLSSKRMTTDFWKKSSDEFDLRLRRAVSSIRKGRVDSPFKTEDGNGLDAMTVSCEDGADIGKVLVAIDAGEDANEASERQWMGVDDNGGIRDSKGQRSRPIVASSRDSNRHANSYRSGSPAPASRGRTRAVSSPPLPSHSTMSSIFGSIGGNGNKRMGAGFSSSGLVELGDNEADGSNNYTETDNAEEVWGRDRSSSAPPAPDRHIMNLTNQRDKSTSPLVPVGFEKVVQRLRRASVTLSGGSPSNRTGTWGASTTGRLGTSQRQENEFFFTRATSRSASPALLFRDDASIGSGTMSKASRSSRQKRSNSAPPNFKRPPTPLGAAIVHSKPGEGDKTVSDSHESLVLKRIRSREPFNPGATSPDRDSNDDDFSYGDEGGQSPLTFGEAAGSALGIDESEARQNRSPKKKKKMKKGKKGKRSANSSFTTNGSTVSQFSLSAQQEIPQYMSATSAAQHKRMSYIGSKEQINANYINNFGQFQPKVPGSEKKKKKKHTDRDGSRRTGMVTLQRKLTHKTSEEPARRSLDSVRSLNAAAEIPVNEKKSHKIIGGQFPSFMSATKANSSKRASFIGNATGTIGAVNSNKNSKVNTGTSSGAASANKESWRKMHGSQAPVVAGYEKHIQKQRASPNTHRGSIFGNASTGRSTPVSISAKPFGGSPGSAQGYIQGQGHSQGQGQGQGHGQSPRSPQYQEYGEDYVQSATLQFLAQQPIRTFGEDSQVASVTSEVLQSDFVSFEDWDSRKGRISAGSGFSRVSSLGQSPDSDSGYLHPSQVAHTNGIRGTNSPRHLTQQPSSSAVDVRAPLPVRNGAGFSIPSIQTIFGSPDDANEGVAVEDDYENDEEDMGYTSPSSLVHLQ